MFPFKQNLWKSRSYDDKVNMQAISTLDSLCPDQVSVEPDPDSGSVGAAGTTKYPLSPHILSSSRNGATHTTEGTMAPSQLPMSQSLCPPSQTSLSSLSSNHHHKQRPLSHHDSLNVPMIDDAGTNLPNRVVAFHIGTPSSCSSLDQDECFSLTTSPLPLPSHPLVIIPPIPPYIPPKDETNSEVSGNNVMEDNQKQTTKL